MPHELDDLLLHYGVKGMRWGVRRNRNKKGGADGKSDGPKKKRKTAINLKKLGASYMLAAVLAGPNTVNRAGMNAVKTSVKVSSLAASKVITPENIRKGKNIIQAMKRSPFRYVDGATMTNVINMPVKYLR